MELSNAEAILFDPELWGGPVLSEQTFHLDFDLALLRLSADPLDTEATEALYFQLNEARASNNLNRLYSMAMTVGAMACLHDHLQPLAERFQTSVSDEHAGDGYHERTIKSNTKKTKADALFRSLTSIWLKKPTKQPKPKAHKK
jgi:hypothetical protein